MPGLYDSTSIYDDSLLSYEGEIYNNLNLPTVGVFIAFDDSPYEPNPNWTEVTQYVRSIPSVRRSRSDDWSAFTGSATVVLSNRDQRFNPFNTSSPYNGKLKPRRQIKIVAVSGQNNYFLFRGYIAGWPVEWTEQGKDSTVTIECFDALALLANETTPQDLAQSYAISLDPVTYFPFNDPIDPISSGKIIKGYGRKPFNLLPLFPQTRFINAPSMADGLSPSCIEIPSATTYDIFYNSTTPSDNVSFSYCGWWTCPNNPDPIFSVRAIGICIINRVLASFQYQPSDGKLRVVTEYIIDATNTTRRVYEASVIIDPTQAHFSSVSINADGTLDNVFLDGGVVTFTLSSTTTVATSNSIQNLFQVSLIKRQNWFIYDRKLTTTEIENIYRLGNARFEESTSARFNRLIALTPFPASLTSVPASPVGVVSELKAGGTSLVNELNVTSNSEGGELYVSSSGVLTMTVRNSQLQGRSATTQAVFKDDGSALKYAGSFNVRFDADGIINDLRLSVSGGLNVNASDINSQSNYGKQSQGLDTYLSTIADAQALADSKVAVFGDPVPTVSPFEVGITRSQSDWQTLLGLEVLDQVEITRTPTSGSVFSDRLLINEIVHSITPGDWSMVITGSARYSEWFTIDIDFINGDRLIA